MQQLPQEKALSNEELAQCVDAQVWAKEFMKALYKNPGIVIDEEFMTGWFANAVMAGWDEADRRMVAAVKAYGQWSDRPNQNE